MYKDIIIKILTATDYTDDKDAFADEFLKALHAQTLVSLFEILSGEHKDDAKRDFSLVDTPDKASLIMKKYFTDEQIQQSLNQTAQQMIADWMKSIEPTLSDIQRQRLTDLSQELMQISQSPQSA